MSRPPWPVRLMRLLRAGLRPRRRFTGGRDAVERQVRTTTGEVRRRAGKAL